MLNQGTLDPGPRPPRAERLDQGHLAEDRQQPRRASDDDITKAGTRALEKQTERWRKLSGPRQQAAPVGDVVPPAHACGACDASWCACSTSSVAWCQPGGRRTSIRLWRVGTSKGACCDRAFTPAALARLASVSRHGAADRELSREVSADLDLPRRVSTPRPEAHDARLGRARSESSSTVRIACPREGPRRSAERCLAGSAYATANVAPGAGLTAVAILTLSLGIGANTAINDRRHSQLDQAVALHEFRPARSSDVGVDAAVNRRRHRQDSRSGRAAGLPIPISGNFSGFAAAVPGVCRTPGHEHPSRSACSGTSWGAVTTAYAQQGGVPGDAPWPAQEDLERTGSLQLRRLAAVLRRSPASLVRP